MAATSDLGHINRVIEKHAARFGNLVLSGGVSAYSLTINNSTANASLFIGYQAGASSTGLQNIGIGYQALKRATSSTSNTVVGVGAGTLITTGSNNTVIGTGSGGTLNTGSQNTAIGVSAGPNLGTLSNTSALGYGAQPDTSNTVMLGNNAVTAIVNQGDGTADLGVIGHSYKSLYLATGSGGGVVNTGTLTVSSATQAATLNTRCGQATFTSQTVAGTSTVTFTITNSLCVDNTKIVWATVSHNGGAGSAVVVNKVTPGTGSFTVAVFNPTATTTGSCTVQITFGILN